MAPLTATALSVLGLLASAHAQRCPNGGPSTVVFNSTAAADWAARPLTNTSRSGRTLRTLEPPDGVLLHGAGQDPGSFSTYAHYMTDKSVAGAPTVHPEIFMSYAQLSSLNTTKGVPSFFTGLAASLACYGDTTQGVYLIPNLGVAMTLDDGDGTQPPYDDKVAAGEYDYAISQLVVGLKALNGRPVLMRIGYEMNGHWNNYGNVTFIAAWTRIHAAVRADPSLASVAFVWDASCDQVSRPWQEFLVDDSLVDWYGVNMFSNFSSPLNHTDACVIPFLNYARAKGFPVLWAETTPREVGSSAAAGAWALWYGPMFDLVKAFDDVVKGWCYINWNWANFPQWDTWKDARVEVPGSVGPTFRNTWGGDGFVHAMPVKSILRALGRQ